MSGQARLRVAILSSSQRGFGAYCLPRIACQPGVEVGLVLFVEGRVARKGKRLLRNLKKAWRIGLLGAVNGVRMRKWYGPAAARRLEVEPLEVAAKRLGLSYRTVPVMNSPATMAALRDAAVDLALSLGNGFIAPAVFTVPRLGTINVHHELLPQFRGAQSVIWQLYVGSHETGFTIHRIDEKIDGGAIVHSERVPIEFGASVGDTVGRSYARLWQVSAERLAALLPGIEGALASAQPQQGGRSYTTPSLWQFLRIWRNHHRMATECRREP